MPYVYVEAARFLLACFTVGAIAGATIAAVRGQRDG